MYNKPVFCQLNILKKATMAPPTSPIGPTVLTRVVNWDLSESSKLLPIHVIWGKFQWEVRCPAGIVTEIVVAVKW